MQTTRLYKEKEHAEVEYIVSLPNGLLNRYGFTIVLTIEYLINSDSFRCSSISFIFPLLCFILTIQYEKARHGRLYTFITSESQVGPVPIDDGFGKEVATQITTTLENNKTFYTDSNGRDFIKRVR